MPENMFACVQNIWLPVTACKGVCAVSLVVPEIPTVHPLITQLLDHTQASLCYVLAFVAGPVA